MNRSQLGLVRQHLKPWWRNSLGSPSWLLCASSRTKSLRRMQIAIVRTNFETMTAWCTEYLVHGETARIKGKAVIVISHSDSNWAAIQLKASFPRVPLDGCRGGDDWLGSEIGNYRRKGLFRLNDLEILRSSSALARCELARSSKILARASRYCEVV